MQDIDRGPCATGYRWNDLNGTGPLSSFPKTLVGALAKDFGPWWPGCQFTMALEHRRPCHCCLCLFLHYHATRLLQNSIFGETNDSAMNVSNLFKSALSKFQSNYIYPFWIDPVFPGELWLTYGPIKRMDCKWIYFLFSQWSMVPVAIPFRALHHFTSHDEIQQWPQYRTAAPHCYKQHNPANSHPSFQPRNGRLQTIQR